MKNVEICFRFEKNPNIRIGGAERQMFLIAKHLKKKDLNFHYIIKDASKLGYTTEQLNGIEIKTFGTHLRNFKPKILNRIFQILNNLDLFLFLKFYKKLNFEMYHLRGANVITGIWAFFSKIVKKKRFIFTIAGARDCIPGTYPWHPVFYMIYKYALKRADLVIVIAEYLKKLLKENYSVDSLVIKSGHPIPEVPFKKEVPPLVLWISRLKKVKRPELFLQIAEELKDLNARFLLIGPGDYKKDEIILQAQNQDNFDFIPGVKMGQDNSFYRKASLLINTSSYEGYPNSFIQAWLCETPVMSLLIDPDRVIKKNNLGFIAKGNVSDMVDKIQNFVENPSELKSIGEQCRRYAIENHNIQRTVNKHLQIYKRLSSDL